MRNFEFVEVKNLLISSLVKDLLLIIMPALFAAIAFYASFYFEWKPLFSLMYIIMICGYILIACVIKICAFDKKVGYLGELYHKGVDADEAIKELGLIHC